MPKVILVGIGGATCSGKTTLAKHLKRILPNSVIIHQDDFAPPQEQVPVHPVYNVQDWDAAPGAIEWPRMLDFLRKVKETGEIPADHRSHDHLNEQKDIGISEDVRDRWVSVFENLAAQRAADGAEEIVWGLVDGFLLYWNPQVIEQLDVRIYLRVPHDVLRQRRHERHGYHTAVQSDPEGTLWRDPPHYWEQIVYPAYVDAHAAVFENGDVEKGGPSGKVEGLVLLESLSMTMGEAVDRSCEVISAFSRST
ncbi:P-loop containing nucleoside triphosphate hydrolase protein [Roridomyces roridus]|uniref:P-loop containing nucleoside triphosphate hydrolase protein n=1 Tax=Roridomyces roridus TaxID=1738132 RepID=A0AAD7CFY4_9AGAR|nr:P-loop containing nucleoside triphosphate hydrolase protein [Roridomyces roridus]